MKDPLQQRADEIYAADRAEEFNQDRCPKCGMLRHDPDRWCNTIVKIATS